MYSKELIDKLWKKKLYTKNFYDSLNGSNSLNVYTRRYYVTLSNNKHKIDDLHIGPWFITGFTEAEGCFSCSVIKSSSYKLDKFNKIFKLNMLEIFQFY